MGREGERVLRWGIYSGWEAEMHLAWQIWQRCKMQMSTVCTAIAGDRGFEVSGREWIIGVHSLFRFAFESA